MNDARGNRFNAAKSKKAWTNLCAAEATNQQVSVITNPVIVTVTWIEQNRKRDPDNIASATKYILDGLQVAGKLKNDGQKEIRGLVHWFKVDENTPRIVVEMEEV
jgi:Holliday junction resolvase RusA-like endonuclease